MSRYSKIVFASFFFVGILYLGYFYQSRSHDDLFDQGAIGEQDKLSLDAGKSVTEKESIDKREVKFLFLRWVSQYLVFQYLSIWYISSWSFLVINGVYAF